MPENRRCPECGKRPTDRLLVQCPDCKVPFVQESALSTALTPKQLRAVARQILASWKFWTGLAVLVVSASWAGIEIVQRMLDARAGDYLRQLDQKTASQMALTQQQLSNQIALELKQPRIKTAIEHTRALCDADGASLLLRRAPARAPHPKCRWAAGS